MKKNIFLFMISFTSLAISSQDSCSAAVTITAGVHTITEINGFEPASLICSGGNDVATLAEWYRYTPDNDYTVTLTTDLPVNHGLDTRFHVYAGVCAALTCLSGDDDSGTGYLSTASFNVLSGNTYYIAFDNRWGGQGFDFQLSENDITIQPITFTQQSISVTGNYKNCIVDMNGDFLDDIVSVNATAIHINHQQNDGSFIETEFPTSYADYLPSWSIAAGDIDGNGYNDLLYGSGSGVTFMKASDDGSSYIETSGNEYVFCQRTNFIDINNDGNLDAYSCHDVAPNVYYINDGAGNLDFQQGGLGDSPSGGNYASLWVDYDNDGDVDLFIAKCNGGGAAASARFNQLHRNNGDGTYTDVSTESGLHDPVQTWSSAWGDYDNDGFMDVFVGASSFVDGAHKFMKNNGDGTFTDVTENTGLDTFTGTSTEHITYDFDNDGYLDIFTADDTIMRNNQDMTFTPINVAFPVGAIGDLNNDGFLDVLNSQGSWYKNDGNDNNWIKINTVGTTSNKNGIGARLQLVSALGTQIRDIRSGEGFRYMSTLTGHFGIGEDTSIQTLTITWPSGIVDVISNPAINTTHTITEGSTLEVVDYNLENTVLYPNPTHNFIQIKNVMLSKVVPLIYDINGKRIFNFNVERNRINIDQLATGTYILLIQDGLQLSKYQFIKR
jgi:hypothetical protein